MHLGPTLVTPECQVPSEAPGCEQALPGRGKGLHVQAGQGAARQGSGGAKAQRPPDTPGTVLRLSWGRWVGSVEGLKPKMPA